MICWATELGPYADDTLIYKLLPFMGLTDVTEQITPSTTFSHDILALVEELRMISRAQFGVQQCVLGASSSQLPSFLPNHIALWHILGRPETEWSCFAVYSGDLTADVNGASLSAKLDRQSAVIFKEMLSSWEDIITPRMQGL